MNACKRWLAVLLLLLLVGLWGCGQTPPTDRPDPPSGAKAKVYTITFVVDGARYQEEFPEGEMPFFEQEIFTSASGAQPRKIVGWDKEFATVTEDTVYTAVTANCYTIQWMLHGGECVETHSAEGELPTPPTVPTAYSDYNVYTFSGWDRPIEPAGCDDFYHARYKSSPKVCHITFSVDGRETTLTVDGGELPVFSGDTAKPEDGSHDYRFIGWDREIVRATGDATYTAQYEELPLYHAEITPAPGGAKGIMSMTFDDGIIGTAEFLNVMFEKYDLRGTCMMIVGSNLSATYVPDPPNLARWRAIFAHGYLEPASHSMTHMVLPTEGWANHPVNKYETIYNNTQINYARELVESNALLRKYFPNYDLLTFAPSNNTLSAYSYETDASGALRRDADGNAIPLRDGGAQQVAAQTYYAVRQGARGFQSLDPTFGSQPGSWHNLYMYGFNAAKEDVEIAKKWVDDAIEKGGWLVTMCHGISANGDMDAQTAETLFAYIGERVKSGELWSAGFSDATKYIRERQNTTVGVTYEGTSITVDLTICRETEDGLYLDENVFRMPLTVKVKVPREWRTVSYSVDGEQKTATVFSEDGKCFAYLELVPGAHDTIVSYALKGER